MIYFYKGAKGRGKTLTMVKDAYLFHLNGYTVFTNMKSVKFGVYMTNEDIIKIDKTSFLKNCVMLIDEVQTLFNSRRSMKKENVNFSYFIQQIRKRNIELLATSQFSNTVDLILRQHIDYMITPFHDKELDVCKVIYLDLNSFEDDNNGIINEASRTTTVYDALPIYKLYNTEELIN